VPDGNNTNPKENESGGNPVPADEPAITETAKPTIEQRESAASTQHAKENPKEPPKMQIWLPILLNAILLVLVAIQAWIYYRQWTVMQEQAGEMRKSTDAAVRAANAAETSVAKAETASHVDQRAWIAPSNIRGQAVIGQPYTIWVDLKNTGKTPAKKFNATFMSQGIDVSDKNPDFLKALDAATDSTMFGLLAPDGVFSAPMPVNKGAVFTQEDFDAITSRKGILLLFGKVTYEDIFGGKHWTVFCYRCFPDNSYRVYSTFNDTD
jgi:hypothetical protein